MESTKSCLDCVHCHKWHSMPTLEQPGEDGWECQHPNVEQEDLEDPEPEEFAKSCPFFEIIDYKAITEFEQKMDALVDKAFEDLRASQPNY